MLLGFRQADALVLDALYANGPLMTKLCYDAGMFALYANNDHSVQQFLPPLVITDGEAEETIRILDQCLATLKSMLG